MLLHYEFHLLLRYMAWWRTAWGLPLLGLWFLGGGVLLWLCGRYFARLPEATFPWSLWVNAAAAFAQGAGAYAAMVVIGLIAAPFTPPMAKSWFVTPMGIAGIAAGPVFYVLAVRWLFHTDMRRALKAAWLPLLVQAVFWLPATVGIPMSGSSICYEIPDRQVCLSNLANLGKQITLYAGRHNGSMPPDLETLAGEIDYPRRILQCPSEPTPADANGRPYDYFYLPADANASPDALLACDFKANHRGKSRNVLYVGMNVMKLPEAAFQRQLARRINAGFARALAGAEAARAVRAN